MTTLFSTDSSQAALPIQNPYDRHDHVHFSEGDLAIKTLCNEDEIVQAYRLRHLVFCDQLKWVPSSPDGLEIDHYDASAISLGMFTEAGRLVGVGRLLTAPGPYMVENELRSVLNPGYSLRREADTAEITRLALAPDLQEKGLSSRMMLVLLKGLYQWLVCNRIRYCYMVVEKQLLRVLRVIGFPCEPISSFKALPPAGALSVAVMLDLEQFRCESGRKRPEFLHWISTLPTGHHISEARTCH